MGLWIDVVAVACCETDEYPSTQQPLNNDVGLTTELMFLFQPFLPILPVLQA
jgi:hypothetical protein